MEDSVCRWVLDGVWESAEADAANELVLHCRGEDD
jgi:hypothetical protein